MPTFRAEIALLAALLGGLAGCASSQDDPAALAAAVDGTGAAGGDLSSGGAVNGAGGGTNTGGDQTGGGSGNGGDTTGSGGESNGTGGFENGTGGFDTGTGGSGTGGVPPFSFGTGGAMSTPDAGSSLKAACAQKLCIDPVFDCVLQGCGFAACTNLHCIVQ